MRKLRIHCNKCHSQYSVANEFLKSDGPIFVACGSCGQIHLYNASPVTTPVEQRQQDQFRRSNALSTLAAIPPQSSPQNRISFDLIGRLFGMALMVAGIALTSIGFAMS